MTDNFVAIDRSVLADPALAGRVRLLSISIDPEFDTPAILRVHAGEVARIDGRVPDNWDFATADPATIRKVAESYGLVYGKEDGQIVHSLRTAVIGRDGRLLKVYRGNEWKPEEILADVRAAVN
jgi:protein SCO1/2